MLSSNETLLLLSILVWSTFIVRLLWSKRQAGYLLLTLRWRKVSGLLAVAAGISLLWVAVKEVPFIYENHPFSLRQSLTDLITFFGVLLLGSYLLLIGLSRPEIREKGIWNRGELIKWGQIESYSWTAEPGNNLMVRPTQPGIFGTRFFGRGCLFLSVPPCNQETVDRLLREHLHQASC